MFTSCCACVHKKSTKTHTNDDETTVKNKNNDDEKEKEEKTSPISDGKNSDDIDTDAIDGKKIDEEIPINCTVNTEANIDIANNTSITVNDTDIVITTTTIATSGPINIPIQKENPLKEPSDSKKCDDILNDDVQIDAENEDIMLDSVFVEEFANESPESIEQSLSDTSNDTTIISKNSPQHVPDDNNKYTLPKNTTENNEQQSVTTISSSSISPPTTSSSPDEGVLAAVAAAAAVASAAGEIVPKSCLSRRCSSRTSIKKKVNYSEDQEIIPAPPPPSSSSPPPPSALLHSPPLPSMMDSYYGTSLDDDEVFSDSVSPKMPRGDMCTPYPKKKNSLPGMVLPDWFFDDREVGGILEPPVTPIGRDELALKRHRFFTDLLQAAQAAVEHRVRFDPFGPSVTIESNDCDPNLKSTSGTSDLEHLINRLEQIVERLERAVSARELERVNSTLNFVIKKTDSEELDSIPLPSIPSSHHITTTSTDPLCPSNEVIDRTLIDNNNTIITTHHDNVFDYHQTNESDQSTRKLFQLNGDQDSVDLDSLPTVLSQVIFSSEEYSSDNSCGTTSVIEQHHSIKQLEDQSVEQSVEQSEYTTIMSVIGYEDLVNGPLSQYLSLSKTIGNDVEKEADIVQRAFTAQLEYVKLASASAQPSDGKQQELLKPTSACIMDIQNFSEKNRSSEYRNHLLAISESISALGWVCIAPTPGPHVKEMICSAEYYTNRILKDYKEKNKTHVDWAKSWIQLLTDLRQYIMQYHTTGLVWSGKTDLSSTAVGGATSAPPPPPPLSGLPPPPPLLSLGDLTLDGSDNDDRSALFAQINQGENITKNLKRVTPDMQTHKNTQIRTGPAPFKAPASSSVLLSSTGTSIKAPVTVKEPVFNRDGKKWIIEHHKSNPNLLVENAEMNNVVYIFKCESSTLTVKGKINSIIMDSCKKCSILFDSVVSSVEFVNCQSVQMQVLGTVPTISVDKTDGCQMYLSSDSLNVEIISSKSSEMNVLIPKGNGDYTEKPIPEQFKTTINGNQLSTVCVESLG